MTEGTSLQSGIPTGRRSGSRRGSPGETSRRSPLAVRRATAGVVAAAIPTYLALRGGAYDLGVRQEFGLVIWVAIAAGLAFGVLPRSRLTWRLAAPLLAIGALGLLSLLSLSWTGSSEHTFAEVARISLYASVVALALFGLNRYTWRAAAFGLGIAAVTVCGLAVASRLAPGSFDNPVAAVFAVDRLSYPLDYWNAVAAWGAITVAIALAWSAGSRRYWIRSAALAAVPVAGTAVYLSYSRGGVIAAAVAIAAVVALSRNRWTAAVHAGAGAIATGAVILVVRDQPQIAHATGDAGAGTVALVLIGAAAACAGLAAVTGAARFDEVRLPTGIARRAVPLGLVVATILIAALGHGPISRAWDQFQNQKTASAAEDTGRLTTAGGNRHDLWNAGLDAFDAHPFGGVGPGTFEFWWAQHGTGHEFVRDAHSLYIEELAELGLPGLLLLVAFLGTTLGLAIRGRIRARRSAEVAASTAMCAAGLVFLVHAGLDWMWEETAVGVLGIGAMAVGAASLSERRRRRSAWIGPRGALVGMAALSALLLVPGLVSASREGQSEQALRAGDLTDARAFADQAVTAQPWAATPYEQRAAVEDRVGRLAEARHDLDDAIGNEPADWRQHLQLAQIYLELGRDSRARAEFDTSRHLNRVSPPFASFTEFRRAATPRCLVLGPLSCSTGSLVAPSDCIAVPPGLAAALGSNGVADTRHAAAVKSLINAFYVVAAPTPKGDALWAVNQDRFRLEPVLVVPLNAAALAAYPPAANAGAAPYLVPTIGIDERAAAACAAR